MKIITATQQGEALIRLSKLNDALMSEDAIKRMDAILVVLLLAVLIILYKR